MTLDAYSDSRRFFQYEISPLFSTVFQKVDGRRRRYAIVISNLHVYIIITGVSVNDSMSYVSDLINSSFWEFSRKCEFHNKPFSRKMVGFGKSTP